MNKAFVRVIHEFLWKILTKFGYPPQFVDLMKNLYKNAKSLILVNGFLTNQIPIKRSVRQGCPLSMVLFVLYIEPLLLMIDETIRGVQIGQITTKSLAYADDICYIVHDDAEADRVYMAIESFCQESGALLNPSKSAFLRLNGCKIGPQRIAENTKLKILGMFFTSNLNETIKINFDNLTANVKFMIRRNSIRNLNIIQKVWFANTFVLSKLWYISQVIPPGNIHVAQMKSAIGNFLWAGHLYRIERKQLWLPRSKGGLGLVSIDDKMKALYLKNLMIKKVNGAATYEPDFLFNERQTLNLPRNVREWAALTSQFNTRTLITTKMIYTEMLERKGVVPKIVQKIPTANWTCIWRNLTLNSLPTDWCSTAYLVINDVIPSGQKTYRHRISVEPPVCSTCGQLDTTDHRVKYCYGSSIIWNFLTTLLTQRLELPIQNPIELLEGNLNLSAEAGLWYTLGALWYNINKFRTGQLEDFKQEVRLIRWQKRNLLKKFGRNIQLF